jgi:phage terminase small subunit
MRRHIRVCAKRVCAEENRVCAENSDDIVMGRKHKPIKAQIAAGDPRKKGVHKLEEQLAAEPKASRGLPPCPEYLEGRAKEAWVFWSEELALMDLDRRPDGPMLEGVCIAYDAAIACYETIKTQGRFIAKKILNPATNKLVVVDVKLTPRRAAGQPGAGPDEGVLFRIRIVASEQSATGGGQAGRRRSGFDGVAGTSARETNGGAVNSEVGESSWILGAWSLWPRTSARTLSWGRDDEAARRWDKFQEQNSPERQTGVQ